MLYIVCALMVLIYILIHVSEQGVESMSKPRGLEEDSNVHHPQQLIAPDGVSEVPTDVEDRGTFVFCAHAFVRSS